MTIHLVIHRQNYVPSKQPYVQPNLFQWCLAKVSCKLKIWDKESLGKKTRVPSRWFKLLYT